jgi:nucleoside-diphosphate-sugar epimerase
MDRSAAERVLVTGASGFIAQHVVLALLRAGWRVRGTLRSLERAERVRKTLAAHVEGTDDRLDFAAADLERDAGWERAVEGCRFVHHVASPIPRQPPAHEDDLIRPAREGTLRVLRAASQAGVERVVMTSSLAAVTYGRPRQGRPVFNEEHWTVLDDPRNPVAPYEKSKTLAERAAWDFVAALPRERRLELVTVNPGFVLGPILDEDWGTSAELVKKLMRRELPACVRVGWAMVDVRDVAAMHLAAMTTPAAAGQRFLCATEHAWMVDVARILERHYRERGYRIPTRELPGWVLRVVARFDKTMRLVVNDYDRRQDVSSERARSVLGWKPRGLEEMVVDMAESLIRHRVV